LVRLLHLIKEAIGTQKSETIIIDGPDKHASGHTPVGKSKRGALVEDELQTFRSITKAIGDVAQVIRDIMNVIEISQSQEGHMVALGSGYQLCWYG
jgi:hypothetical protein